MCTTYYVAQGCHIMEYIVLSCLRGSSGQGSFRDYPKRYIACIFRSFDQRLTAKLLVVRAKVGEGACRHYPLLKHPIEDSWQDVVLVSLNLSLKEMLAANKRTSRPSPNIPTMFSYRGSSTEEVKLVGRNLIFLHGVPSWTHSGGVPFDFRRKEDVVAPVHCILLHICFLPAVEQYDHDSVTCCSCQR